jgi:hypothetical protein
MIDPRDRKTTADFLGPNTPEGVEQLKGGPEHGWDKFKKGPNAEFDKSKMKSVAECHTDIVKDITDKVYGATSSAADALKPGSGSGETMGKKIANLPSKVSEMLTPPPR